MSADILERLLITLAVRIHAFALCEVQEGWRLKMDAMEAVVFHFILQGSGTIEVEGHAPLLFSRNCLLVVPTGLSQTLGFPNSIVGTADAGASASPLNDGLVRFTAGDGTADILCVCGSIAATYGGEIGLFDHLDMPIVQDMSDTAIVRHAFEAMLEETARPGLGTRTMIETLMKQCLLHLLRRHMKQMDVGSPFFAALHDQRLARAVTAIVERPSAPHTVESLASLAGMSRSAFAERFATTFHQGPIEFLQRVRLRVGANLLTTTDLPLKLVASTVGYASRSYFTRAFKAAFGTDPSTYRRFRGGEGGEPVPIEQGEVSPVNERPGAA